MRDDFLWGAATSAYQIEGGVRSEGRGPSIWDTFCERWSRELGGASGEHACEHHDRWEQDLDLMVDLGLGAYRFSIAWPRVQPRGAEDWNDAGVEFYVELCRGLRDRGITPVATLYHWDLPQWVEDAGGWPDRATVDLFVRYVERVHEALAPYCDVYVTVNEPWVSAWLGYGWGDHAPGRTDFGDALATSHHLLLAHARARAVIAARQPDARVGIALSLSPVHPVVRDDGGVDELDQRAADFTDAHYNRMFLDPIMGGGYPEEIRERYADLVPGDLVREGDLAEISAGTDFIGVNYYRSVTVSWAGPDASGRLLGAEQPPRPPLTEMGLPVDPDGLRDLLLDLSRAHPATPLVVTESGAAFADEVDADGEVHDAERRDYLERHVRAVEEAVVLGADVHGYFVWSLLDNFEWTHGYGPRFGLVHVDYATQARTVKASGRWYAAHTRRAQLAAAAAPA